MWQKVYDLLNALHSSLSESLKVCKDFADTDEFFFGKLVAYQFTIYEIVFILDYIERCSDVIDRE